MHDGSLATLEDVVDFYNRGGRPNPNLDPEVQPLRLPGTDQRALVALLRRAFNGRLSPSPAR
jgi:cytochrome c peroxidase